jgi:hypothetical protein
MPTTAPSRLSISVEVFSDQVLQDRGAVLEDRGYIFSKKAFLYSLPRFSVVLTDVCIKKNKSFFYNTFH